MAWLPFSSSKTDGSLTLLAKFLCAMVMEASLKRGVDQMKVVFDLCDQDNDGLICAKDFRKIGQEHFEKPHVS